MDTPRQDTIPTCGSEQAIDACAPQEHGADCLQRTLFRRSGFQHGRRLGMSTAQDHGQAAT
jgi:hypothetical protein